MSSLASMSASLASVSRASRGSPGAARSTPRHARGPSRSSTRVSATGPADVESMSVDERKGALIRLCANSDRGKSATPEAAAAIETLVRSLEAVNPTRDPAVAPGITGKWSLLYTGASAEDAAKRAELEGALGSTLTEVTGSSGNVALATYFQSGDAEAATARDGQAPRQSHRHPLRSCREQGQLPRHRRGRWNGGEPRRVGGVRVPARGAHRG